MFKFFKQNKQLQKFKKFYNTPEVGSELFKNNFENKNEQKKFFWNISKAAFPKESLEILLAPLSKKHIHLTHIKMRLMSKSNLVLLASLNLNRWNYLPPRNQVQKNFEFSISTR
jgi:hypothetical protein